MSRTVLLTDDLIRQALAPSPGTTAPVGLVDGISAGIRRTPQRRTALDRLGVAAPALRLEIADHRLGWLLAAAILAMMILGGVVAGAWLLRDRSVIELVPSGVDVLAPADGYSEAVLDGTGTGWAIGPGHVTRFDPATGEHRSWTIADDAAFARIDRSPVTGAAAGGIWMLTDAGLVRFDGSAFRDPLTLPIAGSEPTAVDESPDGSLWVAFTEGVFRWDGTRWASFPGADACSTLVATGPDEVWASCLPSGPKVLHLADGRWEGFEALSGHAIGGLRADAIAEGPDGSIWVAQARYGAARWIDGRFVDLEGPDFPPDDLQVTTEGDVWVAGEGSIARLVGGAWQAVEPPGAEGSEWLAGIVAVGADLVAATNMGLYRYDTSSWDPLWTDPPIGPSLDQWADGGGLVAVSSDEAWVADGRGVWHYVDGHWVGPDRPAALAADTWIHDLAVVPGGDRVAIATDEGVAIREGDRWAWGWGWRQASVAVDFAPDGSLWALSGVRLVHMAGSGEQLSATTAQCPGGGGYMAVGTDGSVWVGQVNWGLGGLRRYDGTSCREVDVPVRGDVVDVEADPTGGVVLTIVGSQAGSDEDVTFGYHVVRFDGTTWSTLHTTRTPGGRSDLMTVDSAGRVWAVDVRSVGSDARPAFGPGIQRYEDGVGTTVTTVDAGASLSVAPDGTLWFVGSSGIERIDADQLR